MRRVVVFLDYQNVDMQARRWIGGAAPGAVEGQVRPLDLAGMLAGRGGAGRLLQQVRVYRGMPQAGRDPRGHAAATRQVETWRDLDPRVQVLTRPLRYPA